LILGVWGPGVAGPPGQRGKKNEKQDFLDWSDRRIILMAGPMAIDPHVIYPVPADVASIWLISSVGSLVVAGAIFAAIYKPDTAG
jgi:hypothetical protein